MLGCRWGGAAKKQSRAWARLYRDIGAGNQNAGSTAPLYLVSMKAFTCGLVSALASF